MGKQIPFAAPISALRKTALDNKQQFNENVVNAILKRFYVDDYLDSFNDPQTAVKTITDAVALLKLGGFDLANFISNSREILKGISPGNLSPKIVNLDLDELSSMIVEVIRTNFRLFFFFTRKFYKHKKHKNARK